MEEMAVIWLRGQLRAKRAVHQTGRRTMPAFEDAADVRDGQDATAAQAIPTSAIAAVRASAMTWAEPDWGAVLALFFGLLVVASALVYAAGAGVLPKLGW
jgi:hypothetical protein